MLDLCQTQQTAFGCQTIALADRFAVRPATPIRQLCGVLGVTGQ